MMGMSGLGFAYDEISKLASGRCPACQQPLPERARRDRWLTCDAVCHHVWVERLIQGFGETREITDVATGIVYLVPTRVILEQGITTADLPSYPTRPKVSVCE
jgi:hypothetical protein